MVTADQVSRITLLSEEEFETASFLSAFRGAGVPAPTLRRSPTALNQELEPEGN